MSSSISTQPTLQQREPEAKLYWGLSVNSWMRIGVIAGLLLAIFWPNLRRLWAKTNPFSGEANWGHSCIVPLVGLYYLYLNRDVLLKAAITPLLPSLPDRRRLASLGIIAAVAAAAVGADLAGLLPGQGLVESAGKAMLFWTVLALLMDWGLASIVFGVFLYGYGIWPGQNDYLKDVGMVVTLFGVVLALCGWEVMKTAWFPIAFLICALPWPGLVYSWVAGPLQQLAAEVAVAVLNVSGVLADREGTKIMMGLGDEARTLNVAEACAGLRSLMTFISIAAALAFLSARPLWQKIILTLSAIPIAIGCNVMRVAGQGLLDHYVSRAWSEGFAHQFAGLVMLIPAFFLILLVGWLLDRIFIEETEVETTSGAKPAASGLVIDLRQGQGQNVAGTGSRLLASPPPPSVRLATKPRRDSGLTAEES